MPEIAPAEVTIRYDQIAPLLAEMDRLMSTIRASMGLMTSVSTEPTPTWAQAVDRVLSQTDKPLRISDIVVRLRGAGGKFSTVTDAASIIRRTISMHRQRLSWERRTAGWIKRQSRDNGALVGGGCLE